MKVDRGRPAWVAVGLLVGACAVPERTPGDPAAGVLVEADSTSLEGEPRTSVRAFVIPDPPDTVRPALETTPRHPPDTLPLPPFPDTLAFKALVVRELGALDSAVSPAAWQQRYPADSLDRFVPGSGDRWSWWGIQPWEGHPCARSTRRIPLEGGRAALRTVLFYPPPRASGTELPEVRDTLGLDLEACRMGAVWLNLEIEVPPLWQATAADSARFLEPMRSVRSSMEAMLGPPDQEGGAYDPRGWTSDWIEPEFWAAAGVSYLAVYDQWDGGVRAGAWLPSSGIEIQPFDRARALDEGGFDDLREIAGRADVADVRLDSLLATAKRAWMSRWEPGEQSVPDSVLAGRLAAWLSYVDAYSAPHRAAVLYIADRVLSRVVPTFDSSQAVRVGPFEELGARYIPNEIGGSYDYAGNWLAEAHGLAEPGPVHDQSFLLMLRRAFQAPTCNHEEEAFRTVIARGEAFLADRAGTPIAAEVALEVARAYADVVALADEIDTVAESYVDGAPYRDESPAARRTALRYYLRALAGLDDSALSGAAWREAWRLAAGMPPEGTHYVFICD